MNDLLRAAFTALAGPDWTHRELGLVAETLRRPEDREALALLDAANDGDDEAFAELCAIATEAGSAPLVALDLLTVYGLGIEALTGGPHPGGHPRHGLGDRDRRRRAGTYAPKVTWDT